MGRPSEHLRRILAKYTTYYNEVRGQASPLYAGNVIAFPQGRWSASSIRASNRVIWQGGNLLLVPT
jgi:hypothetical protein